MRIVCAIALLFTAGFTHAHLLPAQHATLRFSDGRAYLVLAISPSALQNRDSRVTAMSADEFAARYDELARRVTAGIALHSSIGEAEILDLRLAPSLAHQSGGGDLDQITVLAVFELGDASPLTFATNLFSPEPGGNRFEVVCSDGDGRQRQRYALTRSRPHVELAAFQGAY